MVISLLSEYIYIVLSILVMKYLWQKEIEKLTWKYIIVMVTVSVAVLIEIKLNMEGMIIYPIEIMCIISLLKGEKFHNFTHFFITDIILALFQRLVAYLAILLGSITYSDILKSENEKIILRLSTLILLIIFKGKLQKYSSYLKKLTWYHIVLCIAIGVCLIFIIAQAELGMLFNGKQIANSITMGLIILLCLIILFTIVVFIIVDIYRKYYQEQNKLKDDYLNIQEKYYKTIVDKDEEVRKIRHDLKAHLGCIEILLEEQSYHEARKYIKELKNDTIKRIDTSFKSGNDIINAVLSDVSNVASKHKTQITFSGTLPENIKIKSPDLCSLFYNLLSNSEEAMKYYQGEFPRVIYVDVTNYKNSVGIIVKNPVEKPVEISGLGRYTTKKDKKIHGYGIENIKTIVEKYKGLIEYENKEGYFVCKIIFLNIINY